MKETASQRKKDKVLRTSMYVAVLIGLAGFLIFSILAAITFGNADLSLKDVYSVIAYKLFHIKSLSAYAEGAVHDVVWLIRLPRVLLALAVGMALSASLHSESPAPPLHMPSRKIPHLFLSTKLTLPETFPCTSHKFPFPLRLQVF